MSLHLDRLDRRRQPLTAAEIREAVAYLKAKRCVRCHGTGKVDRGNGTTKPCDCTAGLIERARRRSSRAK